MLTHALLAQAQGSVGRSCHKEGAQGTDDDTDEEGQREVLEGTRPQEQGTDKENRAHRQNTHNRGVDRAHQGLVNRQVHLLSEGGVAALL